MKKHLQKKERKYKCPEEGCLKSYTLATNLTRHMKHHKKSPIKKTQYICSKEWHTKKFPKKYNLKRHEKDCMRPAEGKTTCFICKKVFGKPSNLKRHLLTHTKTKISKTKTSKTKTTKTKTLLKVKVGSRKSPRKSVLKEFRPSMTFPPHEEDEATC